MANNNILEATRIVAENARKGSDRTFSAVVYEKDIDGKYKIPFEGRLRSIANGTGLALSPGQLVWVKIPEGKLREMHICGIRKSETVGQNSNTTADLTPIKKEIEEIKSNLNTCVTDENYVHTDNNFSNDYKNKMDMWDLIINEDGSLSLKIND